MQKTKQKDDKNKEYFIHFANLLKPLNLAFGYVIIFNNGYCYPFFENLDLNTELIKCDCDSCIFGSKDVSGFYDHGYQSMLWDKKQNTHQEYISIFKKTDDHIDLYIFQIEKEINNFFIRNKEFLFEFIDYFNKYKDDLIHLDKEKNFFKLSKNLNSIIPPKIYMEEKNAIKEILSKMHSRKRKLSKRELDIYTYLSKGMQLKTIARVLGISINSVNTYLARIKNKTGKRYKADFTKNL